MKKISNWLFRNDLELNKRWWHRLLKVIYLVIVAVFLIYGILDFSVTGYSKLGKLSKYIPDNPQTIEKILENTQIKDILISSDKFEPYNGKDDSFAVGRDYLCSQDMHKDILDMDIIKYEMWAGKMLDRKIVSVQEFSEYLKLNDLKCVVPTFYEDEFGRRVDMMQAYDGVSDLNSLYIYKPDQLKTVWYFLLGGGTYPGIWFYLLVPVLLVFIYYKVVLYIIFGNKK
jgi:hypothetical protein